MSASYGLASLTPAKSTSESGCITALFGYKWRYRVGVPFAAITLCDVRTRCRKVKFTTCTYIIIACRIACRQRSLRKSSLCVSTMDAIRAAQPRGFVEWSLTLAILGTVTLIWTAVINSRRANLSHIPGPFLARYTDLWSLNLAWQGLRNGETKVSAQREIRARYGDVVRTGPWAVTVFDPAAVPAIYGVRAKLDKVRLMKVE
jgi:hypothetical protein